MDCFGTHSAHAQTCDNVRVQSATPWTASVHHSAHAQTCDNVRVQSATPWTASVHTQHMPKPVITFVFKVLRLGLLPYISVQTWHMAVFHKLISAPGYKKNADSWRRLSSPPGCFMSIFWSYCMRLFYFAFTHPCKKWQVSTQHVYIHTCVALKHSCLYIFRCVLAVVTTKYHCRANHRPGFVDGECKTMILIPVAVTVDECRWCQKISFVIECTLYTPEN